MPEACPAERRPAGAIVTISQEFVMIAQAAMARIA
jgi:hypothetical protein